jgi:polyisoprenoid-binding protein YceI
MRATLRTLTFLALALSAAGVRAERWTVAASGAEVVFTSKAPLETFEGRTDKLSGWVDFDPAALAGALAGEVVVDLASFDTGKRKRNEHMRENHLETGRFPVARLVPVAVLDASTEALPARGPASLRLRCELDLHGVTRTLDCEVSLERTADGALHVAASFPVLLSQHAIERPRFLVMKLADEQQVAVRFVLTPQAAP